MDGVARSIGEELDLDVTGTLKEPLDEDCTITECSLGLAHGTLK